MAVFTTGSISTAMQYTGSGGGAPAATFLLLFQPWTPRSPLSMQIRLETRSAPFQPLPVNTNSLVPSSSQALGDSHIFFRTAVLRLTSPVEGS